MALPPLPFDMPHVRALRTSLKPHLGQLGYDALDGDAGLGRRGADQLVDAGLDVVICGKLARVQSNAETSNPSSNRRAPPMRASRRSWKTSRRIARRIRMQICILPVARQHEPRRLAKPTWAEDISRPWRGAPWCSRRRAQPPASEPFIDQADDCFRRLALRKRLDRLARVRRDEEQTQRKRQRDAMITESMLSEERSVTCQQ